MYSTSKKSVSSVCSQWQLAARQRPLQNVYQPDVSSGSQRSITTRRHVGTVGKMALTSGWQYEHHDFQSLGPLRSTWLVSNLLQTRTRTKLSRPRCCTDTRHQLLLRLYTSLPAAVGEVLDVSGGWLRGGPMLAICGVCNTHTFGLELSSRNQSVCYPVPWNFLVVLSRFDMQFNEVAPLHIFFTATLRSSTTRILSTIHLINYIATGLIPMREFRN